MSKDHDKYVYVEVALPRNNPAVQHLIEYAEETDIPLRVLVRSAAILAYSTDEEDGKETTKPVPKIAKPAKKKRHVKGNDSVISDAAREAASEFLDDLGF